MDLRVVIAYGWQERCGRGRGQNDWLQIFLQDSLQHSVYVIAQELNTDPEQFPRRLYIYIYSRRLLRYCRLQLRKKDTN
jgi:hypothetical protein